MNLPPFPDDYIPTSQEARRRLIAWGMDCARMGAEAERLSFYSAQVSGEPATVREPDNCEQCHGTRGGVRGNENRLNGKVLCDYCTADRLRTDEGRGE